ncbi:TolC family protein [Taibaiella soli]|uniref:TolC family protein n=1 Tax=Taibaiella soli TaxID=1649169 RepID=A0A2W2C363_9BACT|nr:TolC family protein [Taibaiella soli]PZF74543.1 TolC family protein [Taibaiella soli]
MKRLKFLLIAAITLLSAGMANAQQVLSLQDCLRFALDNNQNIAIKKYEQLEGDQKVVQARSQALPQVNGNANFTDNFKKQVIVLPGELTGNPGTTTAVQMGTTYNPTASVDVSQQLLNVGVFTALKAAETGRHYYTLNTQLTEEQVINQVAQMYYQICATKASIKILNITIQNLEKLVASTDGQYKSGLARKIDLQRIQVKLTNTKTQLTEKENQLVILGNNLKLSMGMQPGQEIAIAEIPLKDIEQKVSSDVAVAAFNLSNLTEMKILDVQKDLYTLQKKASQAEYYPKLSAFANYSYNGMSNSFGDMFKNGGSDVWYGTGAFGLRLSVPIFDGFNRRSKVAMDKIALKKLAQQKEYTEISLNASYNSAKLTLYNTLNAIRSQQENVSLADEVYQSSSQNYNLGIASLTDLLDAENSFEDAQNAYTQALLNYKLAELETLKATGNIKTLLNN